MAKGAELPKSTDSEATSASAWDEVAALADSGSLHSPSYSDDLHSSSEDGSLSLSSDDSELSDELLELIRAERAYDEAHQAEVQAQEAELAAWEAEEAEYQLWQEAEVFLPTFADETAKYIAAYNEASSQDEPPQNFLLPGSASFEKIARLAQNEMVSLDFRMSIEQVIQKILEEEYGPTALEDNSPDEIANQMLEITLEQAAEEFQDGKISQEQFDTSLQLINNLGLPVPLKVNAFTAHEFSGDNPKNYALRQRLQELGIINDDFNRALRQNSINRLFQWNNLPVPENLQNLSDEAHAYWQELSDRIGCDAMSVYTSAINLNMSIAQFRNPNQDDDITPAIYFNDQSQITPIALARKSPLLEEVFSISSNIDDHIGIRLLVQEFADQLEPVDKFFFTALTSEKDNELNLQNSLCNALSKLHNQPGGISQAFDIQDNTAVPTEEFWHFISEEASDLGAIKLFPDYAEHYSPERIAIANYPSHLRQDFRSYIKEKIGYANYRTEFDKLVENTVLPNGELQPWFYQTENSFGDLACEQLLIDFPDQLSQHFDATEQSYLSLPKGYRQMLQTYFADTAELKETPYTDFIKTLVTADGPSDELSQLAFKTGRFDLLATNPLKPLEEAGFTKQQLYAISKYRDLVQNNAQQGPIIGQEYANAILMVDINDLTFDQIDSILGITNRVTNSNAIELRRAGRNFLHEIVASDHPDAKLNQIEQVFLHNNLPYAGKVFRTFQVLHPAENSFSGEFEFAVDRGVLKNLPDTGVISRESVLFADLIKASIGSNNRSMKQYIQNLRAGQALSEQLLNDNLESADLSEIEQATLKSYLTHLQTLYDQTRSGQNQPFISSGDIKQDLSTFMHAFGANERHSLPDRVVRSFCYMLGIRGLDDLENYMTIATSAADTRGRERFAANDFSLKKDDLVKAVDAEYIGKILQNGSICKEFLNGEAESDATPLDTDLTRLGAECTGDISSAIDWKNRAASFSAMAVNLVIKDSEIIQTNGEKYDPSKLELFYNGGEDYGIRTGFPSSAIDFIVYDSTQGRRSSQDQLSFICSEIAKNGFYIPVVDKKTGSCVFSPSDYDDLRQKLSGLEYYGVPEYHFANDADLYTPGIEAIANLIPEQEAEVDQQRRAVEAELQYILARNLPNFQGLKTSPDGDLTAGYVELFNTGSTGRGTSIPGSKIDFDFIMRLDASLYNNPEALQNFEQVIRQSLNFGINRPSMNGLRLSDVEINGLSAPVQLDISFMQRTNHMDFSTDQAITERLQNIKAQSPERYPAVIANIILAKQVLKNADAYKPRHSGDETDPDKKGGLGGVGIENWILQHGGSFKAAAEDFVAAAEAVNGNFNQFSQTYQIWDPGQNHFTVRDNEENQQRYSFGYSIPYDNFVTRNMSPEGFTNMIAALKNYLSSFS